MTLGEQLREVWSLRGMKFTTLWRRVYKELSEDNIWGYAAQLAYYFLFALFPFLMFLAALLAYIPLPDLMEQIMALIGQFVPGTAAEMVQDNVKSLVSQPRGALLSFSMFLSLWVASSAIVAIAESLNHAYGVKESRPYWKVRGMGILMTIGLAAVVIASMVLLIFGPQLGHWLVEYFGLGTAFDVAWLVLRWPVVLLLMMVAAALIYYFAPDVEQDWRWITPGSVFAILLWVSVSLGFSYYANNFGQYDRTYGSIGAVIVLLTWMYLSGLSLLMGGEINAEIEHAAAEGKDPGEKQLPHGNRTRGHSDRVL